MIDAFRVLSQVSVTGTGNTVLYSVPDISNKEYQYTPTGAVGSRTVEVSPKAASLSTQTLVSSVFFSLDSSTSNRCIGDLELSQNANDLSPTFSTLLKDCTFYDGNSFMINAPITLPPNSSLRFNCSAITGTLYITAFGVEIRGGYGPS